MGTIIGIEHRAKSKENRLLALCPLLFALCPMLFATFAVSALAADGIQTGSIVTFHYNLRVNGHVMESTEGKEPIKYMQGQGTLVPGLEKALEGMTAGEEKIISIPPEEAYGKMLKEAIKEVPKENFPEDFEFVLGSLIQLEDKDGKAYPGIIWDIKEKTVAVNFNHPLAGQTLIFEIQILSID